MAGALAPREGQPCLSRECGHPDSVHYHTPELAGPMETVVFCAACRRHEIRRLRGWFSLFGRSHHPSHHRTGRVS